jgi:serine/threonine-protein kinase
MAVHNPCNRRPACDPGTIGQFLDERLSDQEQSAFEAHLDECAVCREQLECMTADRRWWDDARAYLAPSHSSLRDGGTSDWPPEHGGDDERRKAALFGLKNYLAPTDDPRMLGRIGAYEVPGIVGAGGFGVVLKGFDAALNRYVAIKVLSPSLAANGAARRRFAREAQAAAAVVHDNVMAIHAVSEAQGLPYLVMPYVRGASLQQRLTAAGPLAIEEILRIALQVASGLAAAHAQGLVHRDIKPANILLEDGVERVKITDFGLARAVDDASLTGSGSIAGTPQYMSPEQASGESIDHRSDLFSLGSVIYAMSTGRPPFRAETSYGVLRRICESEPREIGEINSALPAWLSRIVARLHEKDPACRFASAAEVASLLERCLAHVQQPAGVALPAELTDAVSPRPNAGAKSRVADVLAGAAAVATVTIVALVAGIGKQAAEADRGSSVPPQRIESPSEASPWQDGIDGEIESLAESLVNLKLDLLETIWHDRLTVELGTIVHEIQTLETAVDETPGASTNVDPLVPLSHATPCGGERRIISENEP